MNSKNQIKSVTLNAEIDQNATHILRNQILGFRNTQLIAGATKLNLAEHLKDGPKTIQALANAVNTNGEALYRLMRALTSIGIFIESRDQTFSNNNMSSLLLDSTTGSLRNIAILYGESWLWSAYGSLMYSIKTGKAAFNEVHGQGMYDFFETHGDAANIFNKAMSAFSEIEAQALVKAYNFSSKKMVVDIGGGEGTLVNALLKVYSNLSGIVFDLLAVENSNDKRSSRISYIRGDFFKEVPNDGDFYILKSVLHNWDNDSCTSILKNCRKAMQKKSCLLVIERVIPEIGAQCESKLFDINMLVMVGGKERTEDEYRRIFREAGFSLRKVIPTECSMSILEAVPE